MNHLTLTSPSYSRALFAPNEPATPAPEPVPAATPPASDPPAEPVAPPAGDPPAPAGEGDPAPEPNALADAKDGEAPKDEAKPEGDDKPVEAAPFAIAAPEGFEGLDTEALAAASPLLRELGVDTDERAQEVVGKFAPVIQGMLDKALVAQNESLAASIAERNAKWATDAAADAEFGGSPERYAESMTLIAKARDAFASPELIQFAKDSGMGNHPELLRLFYRMGKSVSEAAVHRSDTTAAAPKTFGEKAYAPEFHPK